MTSADRGSGQPTASATSETDQQGDLDVPAVARDATGQDSAAEFTPSQPIERVWATEPNKAEADRIAETEAQDDEAREQTLVIEDGVVSKRLRRPMDLVRLIVAV